MLFYKIGGTNLGAGAAIPNGATIAVASAAASGELTATVNGVSSINNSNSNAAIYNQKPNGLNNNTLTDDVFIDIWQFNPKAVLPSNGTVEDAVMKINPKTGIIGFAFANGSNLFSMPSDSTSYTKWQKNWDDYGAIGLAYDPQGGAHGVASVRDTNYNEKQAGPFTYFFCQGCGSRRQ
ncbi:hypothetical protein [Treponema phagedenis]|uniref:hypothetical protein n=1 Tax=Treponema phagedenis TaxID=162 RepID=UPI0015A5ABC1|nr:hypothetical protein [Treponema phagedenis]NVP25683.1 hypothetical protein [Treponema phagedenis]